MSVCMSVCVWVWVCVLASAEKQVKKLMKSYSCCLWEKNVQFFGGGGDYFIIDFYWSVVDL